ncbi:MAG: SMC-Scp complex subunit ScpB [Phycisphaerales bacterium]
MAFGSSSSLPILRADLESIRGVAGGVVLRSLMDRRLVKIVGRADEVGRPMLYGTTSEFLRQFGIGRLDELPNAKDLR